MKRFYTLLLLGLTGVLITACAPKQLSPEDKVRFSSGESVVMNELNDFNLKITRIDVERKEEDSEETVSKALQGKIYILKLEACGFVEGMRYSLYSMNLSCMPRKLFEFQAINGRLYESEGIALGDLSFTYSESYFIPGEPIFYSLISEDNRYVTSAMHVSKPIETTWEDGARVSLVMLTPETFFIKGEGFKPLEVIDVTSKSCEEILSGSQNCTALGTFYCHHSSAVIRRTGGEGLYAMKRKGFDKARALKYRWGTHAISADYLTQ